MTTSHTVLDAIPNAASLGVPQVVHVVEAPSTMDIAHGLATDGASAGTLIVADHQLRGRGRSGKPWTSQHGAGLWMTLIERPSDQRMVGVLALRLGLAIAEALTRFVDAAPRVKWPNDVFVGDGKISGILVEARWRAAAVDWVAIGIGINLTVPSVLPDAAAVRPGTLRSQLMHAVVPAIRRAAAKGGPLSVEELAAWTARDMALGRCIREPRIGRVRGINADGALLVETGAWQALEEVHAGSLVFDTSEGAC